MMEVIYWGNSDNGYHAGWRDNVDSKAAYLLNLVHIGISAQSTYLTLISVPSD